MASRLKLQEELESILGTKNVYYQPPESIKMAYPAIVYKRTNILANFANNGIYKTDCQYSITVIDRKPDSPFVEKILKHFKMIRYDRAYIADGLNHDVFTLFY